MARQQEDRFARLAPTPSGMREDNSESTRSSSRSKRSYDFMSKFTAVDLPPSVVSTVGPEQREAVPLPNSYQVTDFDVVCGRGRAHVKRPGNQRFRRIVENHAHDYEQATSKIAKTSVLCTIVEEVMAGNTIIPGRFVKEVDGHWVELPPVAAREKAGHAIRDVLVLQQASQEEGKAKKTYKRQARTLSGDELQTPKFVQQQQEEPGVLGSVMNRSWPTFGGMANNLDMMNFSTSTAERGFQSEPNLFASEDLTLFANKPFPEEQPSAFNDDVDLSPTPLAPNARLEPSFQPGSNAILFSSRQFSSPVEEELRQFHQHHHPTPHAATSSHFGGDDLRSLFASGNNSSLETTRTEQTIAKDDEDELFGRIFFSLSDKSQN